MNTGISQYFYENHTRWFRSLAKSSTTAWVFYALMKTYDNIWWAVADLNLIPHNKWLTNEHLDSLNYCKASSCYEILKLKKSRCSFDEPFFCVVIFKNFQVRTWRQSNFVDFIQYTTINVFMFDAFIGKYSTEYSISLVQEHEVEGIGSHDENNLRVCI